MEIHVYQSRIWGFNILFYFKVIYSVTVVTGDTQYAGTDTRIYLTVFGANGSTEEMLLPKNEDRLVFRFLHSGKRNVAIKSFF